VPAPEPRPGSRSERRTACRGGRIFASVLLRGLSQNRQALAGEDITVYGDGTQSRCFTHVDDSADALLQLMDCDEAIGQPFNIGCPTEVTIQELATEVETAVEPTENGADAVEQLMRAVFDHFRDRLELFMLFHKMGPGGDFEGIIGPAELERIHPLNTLLYGGAEHRLRADQKKGVFPRDRDPRRFAFTAHMAVIGLLNMKAIAASAADPLIHSDDDLIDDLCMTFRDAALQGGAK